MADEPQTPVLEKKPDPPAAATPEEKKPDPPAVEHPQAVEALEKGYHGESAADHGYEDRPQDVAEFGKFTDFR